MAERVYPNASSDIRVAFFFWVWMFAFVAFSSVAGLQNQAGAINPIVLFSVPAIGVVVIAFREAKTTQQLSNALGFNAGLPGFGFLNLLAGLGFGAVIFSLFTNNLASILGSSTTASLANPFYNPYTAGATAYIAGITSIPASFAINAIVAIAEEIYKIALFKITANWLIKQLGMNKQTAMIISLFLTLALWGLWHWYSWQGLGFASIILAVVYGILFYLGNFIYGATDIIPPGMIGNTEITETLSGLIIYNTVGTHFAWNVLIAENGLGYSAITIGITGTILFVTTTTAMIIIRSLYSVPTFTK